MELFIAIGLVLVVTIVFTALRTRQPPAYPYERPSRNRTLPVERGWSSRTTERKERPRSNPTTTSDYWPGSAPSLLDLHDTPHSHDSHSHDSHSSYDSGGTDSGGSDGGGSDF